MGARQATAEGCVAITIDTRTNDAEDRARWQDAEQMIGLLTVISTLAGPNASIFFDFGVITIRDVNLGDVATRFRGAP